MTITPRSDVAHLYRRAGFGATAAQLDAASARSYEATVDELLKATPTTAARPSLVTTAGDGEVDTVEERRARAQTRRAQRVAISTWWLEQMAAAEQPLIEKMTLFWHAHFATSIDKVNEALFMFGQNETMRTGALGRFEPLVQAIAKDPAMMIWLDANQNRRGSPNENFARELMELFTIGIGSYTEADVAEGARAFTGWRINRRTGAFSLMNAQVDRDPKTILGMSLRTGEELVTLLATSPSAARFVTWKLWSRFAAPADIESEPVRDLAGVFQSSGGEIRAVMRALFLHPQFLSTSVRQGLVKQPIEYVIGALRAAGLRPTELEVTGPAVLATLGALNQQPFDPPSVGGWPQNGYWLSTATALSRLKFANGLAGRASLDWLAGVPAADRPNVLANRLGIDVWSGPTAASLRTAAGPRQQFALALTSPEFVLN